MYVLAVLLFFFFLGAHCKRSLSFRVIRLLRTRRTARLSPNFKDQARMQFGGQRAFGGNLGATDTFELAEPGRSNALGRCLDYIPEQPSRTTRN